MGRYIHSFFLLVVVGIVMAELPALAQTLARISLTVPYAPRAPVIDGLLDTEEWMNAVSTPVEFLLSKTTFIRGTLKLLADRRALYLGVELEENGARADELDVALDQNGNGRLEEGDPAYLFWKTGRAQGFHFVARRRAFVRDRRDSGNDFLHATVAQGSKRTFEFTIPFDVEDPEDLDRLPTDGPLGLALKIEQLRPAGIFDTWPTPGRRNALTRAPETWALLNFASAPSPPTTATPAPLIPTTPAIPTTATPLTCISAETTAALNAFSQTRDPLAFGRAFSGGKLHLGLGQVGQVWGATYTFSPTVTDALALGWAGLRHNLNPNYLAALGIKESRYACARYADGCFQIEAPTFLEFQRQFPETFAALSYTAVVQSPALAPQAAAFHLRFTETLFQRWYNWDDFITRAADPQTRLKLLTRAYNRGAWDRNLAAILTRDAERCRAAADLVSCYDAHAGAKDHTVSIVNYQERLQELPGYERLLRWEELRDFLQTGVRPWVDGSGWNELETRSEQQYNCLRNAAGQFAYSTEFPKFAQWLNAELPALESPRRLEGYTSPTL